MKMFAPKTQSDRGPLRIGIWFNLPIGLRLFLAFMTVILLTALIGVLAIQQISSLTDKAAEINARDLPESIILAQLRSLLYQQVDLEQSLLNGNELISNSSSPFPENVLAEASITELQGVFDVTPTPTTGLTPDNQAQRTVAELTTVRKEIAKDCQQLLTLERSEAGEDLKLAQQITSITGKTNVLSARIQALVEQGYVNEARSLEFTQQEPLLLSAVTIVTRMSSLEQTENANDVAQAQQDSRTSIFLLCVLTICGLLLSLVLAILMTRSLTRPLKALVQATEAIAAGNLDVEPRVKRSDEIGRLASAYDKMRLSLRATIDRLHRERQQTQAIIDASADGIMLVDATYKIVTCNPAAEFLTGWPTQEVVGRYCWEILGFQEPSLQAAQANDQLVALLEALRTRSEPSSFEMLITTRHGKQRWLAISCAPLPLDEQEVPQATVIGLHDISQFKAVDQMKSDFVAMVSHELRAPLTTVSGSVETLRLLEPGTDTESYREVLGILDQQTRRLRRVVEEVLQLTRFEAGRLHVQMQPVSLARFLRGLVDSINAEWDEDDHYIILHPSTQDSLVWADAGLLEIVLRNLFENARKYTPQGTAVEVETERIAANDQVQIRVLDHGPGIPADQLESIFERFSRGTQATGNWTRGYGLGLYIARELMQAQNGSIRADQRATGACFVLSLWMVTDDPHDPGPLKTDTGPAKAEEQEKELLA
jgi:two-component system phosphate regulon sensor histidine kinase PhoR